MLNRLMDLVVLVAELSQNSRKSLKELDTELLHQGYSSEEIEQAFSWMSSLWHPVDAPERPQLDRPAFRVLSPWEATGLDAEAYSYLLRLKNLGIVDEDQFETIMNRVLPFGEKLSLSDLKSLAGAVVFHLATEDMEESHLRALDDEIQLT